MAKEPKRIGYELLDEELQALIGGETGEATTVEWSTILNKPTEYPPTNHTHADLHTHQNKNLLDSITAEKISQWETVETHIHDERYYTESEVNTLLDSKSDVGHTHTGISPAEHTHSELDIGDLDKYTKAEIDAFLLNKSPTTHNHDGAYYKKSEVDSKNANKADKVHSHTKANITDFAHTHTVGEITNLNIPTDTNQLNKSDVYTKAQIDLMMVESGAGDMTKAVYDTDNDGKVNAAVTADSVPWNGVLDKPESFPPDYHIHSELHTHINKHVLDLIEEAFTTAMKDKLESLSNYVHPIGDGNLHVPANGTSNAGKILKSTATAGGIGWGSLTPVEIGAAPATHMHTIAQISNFPTFSRLTLGKTQPTDGYWLKVVD